MGEDHKHPRAGRTTSIPGLGGRTTSIPGLGGRTTSIPRREDRDHHGGRTTSIPGVRRASITHLRHLNFPVCVFVVLVHELLHLVAQVVILGVLLTRRRDGSIYPPLPMPVSTLPPLRLPSLEVPFPKEMGLMSTCAHGWEGMGGRRSKTRGKTSKTSKTLTTPAPFLALSSSWKKFSSSLPSM